MSFGSAGARAIVCLIVLPGAFAALLGDAPDAGATPRPRPVVFVATESPVTAAVLRFTWRPGCPVGTASLALLHLRYVGFDHRVHTGEIVVNRAVVPSVEHVFATLFASGFPIASMKPEDVFGGSDPASMAADNTSGFNCRLAVTTGPPVWSVHAYGEAIDVNPLQNPYVEGGRVQPAGGVQFLDRRDVRPGMAVLGGALVTAFREVGWFWGGRWLSTPDYQHFSATGG